MAGPSPHNKSPHPPRRSKYETYARPLPLQTHPLPAFIPQNPLSILRIAWVLVSELIYPPSSHDTSPTSTSTRKPFKRKEERYTAYLDSFTSTVHVTDHDATRALWEQGFFGKGSLSRSEPEWLARMEEKSRKGQTAMEVTNERRRQRREMKMQRAKEELEALEKVREEELRPGSEVVDAELEARMQEMKLQAGSEAVTGDADFANGDAAEAMDGSVNGHVKGPTAAGQNGFPSERVQDSTQTPTVVDTQPLEPVPTHVPSTPEVLTNQEHLQLTPSEVLFLVYGLGVLSVLSPETQRAMTVPQLLNHFARTASFPPIQAPQYPPPIANLEPDNPFLLDYVVYHHFRSLGWVVRPGIKFSVDYLLYARGPVFSHAQFSVVILPAYTHPYWTSGECASSRSEALDRKRHAREMEKRDWWWFHNVSRVQAQVLKTLVLCFVDVPPPMKYEQQAGGDASSLSLTAGWGEEDLGALLRRYRVREVVCRRWTPQRNLK